MVRVLEVSLGFPTVIFTTLTLFSFAYWILTTGLGIGETDFDFDVDVDADVDIDLDGGNADGFGLGAALQFLDLHLLPLSLGLTIISLVGWAVSAVATLTLTSDGGSLAVVTGVLVFLGALVVAVFLAGRIGRLLRPLFETPPAVRRRDLIGRLCTVSTGRVDASFGQAEVSDAEQSTHTIQVRCEIDNELRKGSKALIISVDEDGYFTVSPDVDALT